MNSVYDTKNRRSLPEYHIWKGIRARCYIESATGFKNYGGRGIYVHPLWDNFWQFYDDMGPRPSPKHTIERVNNDMEYAPYNCIWDIRKNQYQNFRRNRKITYNGITMNLGQWEAHLNLPTGVIKDRLNKLNWSIERALSTPKLR